MLIKIKQDSISIVKHSLTTFEREYFDFIVNHTETISADEQPALINIEGSKEDLYVLFYRLSEKCDLELM